MKTRRKRKIPGPTIRTPACQTAATKADQCPLQLLGTTLQGLQKPGKRRDRDVFGVCEFESMKQHLLAHNAVPDKFWLSIDTTTTLKSSGVLTETEPLCVSVEGVRLSCQHLTSNDSTSTLRQGGGYLSPSPVPSSISTPM